ncbi:NAD(P)/FAD-dependent oxidoreductase [Leifsonia sp. C5G2]|uniref:NAD(P)/FAD-dependent oxidoreductase n=1 Tax=Leifsonia sp. C5G2 TaxID=2735269 RepID=UPI001584FEB6|nr:NAD(P)/FAD-dependent oxidoreductase [Leifsonia sp. C5G2]NUU06554.1 NAD(P)/FAD-dependent oxidoreductase [Leifsonia sp. C5G2]
MNPQVVVVGGGPIGLACAIEARVDGLDVVLVEPRVGPIDKACGEGLMPGALAALHRIGVDPPGRRLDGIAYIDAGSRVEHRFADRPGRGVRRTVLHQALAERAAELGADRIHAKVTGLQQSADVVELTLSSGETLRTPWVIAADGLHSPVRRMLRLDGRSQPGTRRRFGLRKHFGVEPWTSLVEVHWAQGAEAYVTPVDERTVGVAVLGGRPLDVDEVIAGIPELSARLDGVASVTDPRGAGPLLQRARSRSSGRVLLAGDASGYVDALTGEGMRVGFAQARSAIAAVSAGDAEQYERAWRTTTRDFRLLTSALVVAARSRFRSRIVPTAARRPELFGSIVERLSR